MVSPSCNRSLPTPPGPLLPGQVARLLLLPLVFGVACDSPGAMNNASSTPTSDAPDALGTETAAGTVTDTLDDQDSAGGEPATSDTAADHFADTDPNSSLDSDSADAGEPPDCDDGLACTLDQWNPVLAECEHQDADCDDGKSATMDTCVEPGGCQNTPGDCGDGCDDGDACTKDACAEDDVTCLHTPIDCSDTNACTLETCAPDQGCIYPVLDCDDDDPITDDLCLPISGCSHVIDCANATCDDGDPATDDSCDPASGCMYVPNCLASDCVAPDACWLSECTAPELVCVDSPLNCDDSDEATDDSCDPATGCVHTPNCLALGCDSTDPCVVAECVAGICVPTDLSPDHGCEAMQADSCADVTCPHGPPPTCGVDPTKVMYLEMVGACLDTELGPVCLWPVAATTGCAQPPPEFPPVPCLPCLAGCPTCANGCDDGDDCTVDSCGASWSGLPQCVHELSLLGCGVGCQFDFECEDGANCTADFCVFDGFVGTCVQAPFPCDDGDPCTTDSCDPSLPGGGKCVFEPVPACNGCSADAECDDGDLCTLDTCTDGACGYSPAICSDGDPTTCDVCDSETGCNHVSIEPCDDGNPCTEDAFSCETLECEFGSPCNDGVPCTKGWCDGATCTQTVNCLSGCEVDAQCEDGNLCTLDSCVHEESCTWCNHEPIVCDDGDPSTLDVCIGLKGCVAIPDPWADASEP